MDYVQKQKIAVALYIVASKIKKKQNLKKKSTLKKRSIWVREWFQNRSEDGAYESTFREIENQNFLFKSYVRMSEQNFNELVELTSKYIQKQDTTFRKAIPVCQRLACTLRYLATGDNYKSLSVFFRIAPNTISKFIPEVCDAIFAVLKNDYLKMPSTQQEWTEVASKFETLWNFPNCIGAVDGKHVTIITPPKSGSTFYNYKPFHSIVLMAVVDAEYKYLYVDVDSSGRISDGVVFKKSSLQQALDTNSLNLPTARPLPGREVNVPFVLLADDAFRMQTNLLKPYPGRSLSAGQRIFNYRLSRAKRIVENVFGIMTKRFEVFSRPIKLNENKATRVTLACCALHNFLVTKNPNYTATLVDRFDEHGNLLVGARANDSFSTVEHATEETPSSNICNEAKAIRHEYENYFMSPAGELSWQYKLL